MVNVYANEISTRNWKPVVAGLALYAVHWFYEILNALIQHFTGHALWMVPTGTAFLILIGVGEEISLMFSIAGLAMSKLLPADPKLKILGVINRLLIAIANATFFAIVEFFSVMTPTFVWVYPWWGAFQVFALAYIPFFLAAFYCYDWKPANRLPLSALFSGLMLLCWCCLPASWVGSEPIE